MFLAVATGLLLISGLIGYGVFVASHRLQRRSLRAVIAIGCALLLLIASTLVYDVVGMTPANNERVGSEQRFQVEVRGSDVGDLVDQLFPSRSPATVPLESLKRGAGAATQLPVLGYIEVRAPSRVTPRQDFSLALSISSRRPMPVDVREVRLSAPRSAEVRTLDACPSEAENSLAACSTPVDNRFQVAWDVTPTEPGQLLFTIGVPSKLMPQSGVAKWEAVAVGPYGSGGRGESATMSASSPAVTWLGMSTDMHSGQLRVPVEVVDTLGVSRSAYNALALIGTVLSALLGSGWLWKLLDWWRMRGTSAGTGRVTAA